MGYPTMPPQDCVICEMDESEVHMSTTTPTYPQPECRHTRGAFSHSAGTTPIIMLFIPRSPLKTTHLKKHA